MQAVSASVGPLIASNATLIAASQSVSGAQGVAFTGSGSTNVSANIAASQSLAGAGPVTLVTGIAPSGTNLVGGGLPKTIINNDWVGSQIVISSSSNNSGITFTVVGFISSGALTTDTIVGPNNGVSASTNLYISLIRITASGATTGTISIGTATPVQMDNTRQIAIASAGNDSGITFKIVGRDKVGSKLTETVTGANAGTATSALDYYWVDRIFSSGATASTITIGTNGISHSPWISCDSWAAGPISISANVVGTVNYTIQLTNDDPNSLTNPVTPANMNWQPTGVAGATASAYANLTAPPAYIRTLLNSGTGSVGITIIQAENSSF